MTGFGLDYPAGLSADPSVHESLEPSKASLLAHPLRRVQNSLFLPEKTEFNDSLRP
jgi:hypothetical protein